MTEPTEEQLRVYSRKCFVDNEVGSDEYRESQPEKGLGMIAHYLDILEAKGFENPLSNNDGGGLLNRSPSTNAELRGSVIRRMSVWLAEVARGYELQDAYEKGWWVYAGTDELGPLLEEYHDLMWDLGGHPYGEDYRKTIGEDYKEDHPEDEG